MKSVFLLSGFFLLSGCVGSMNPTGGNSTPDYPYFITTSPITIKQIPVPTGTKLIYTEQRFKKGKQDQILPENKLKEIKFQEGATMLWGGVPIHSIDKFFNSAMTGYTVYADFSKLSEKNTTRFSKLWQSCSDGIGITVKNTQDWSFNKNNIADVESCSVIYQRYFKDDIKQQAFLDDMYKELNKIESQ